MIKQIYTLFILILGGVTLAQQRPIPLVKLKEQKVIFKASKGRLIPRLILEYRGQLYGVALISKGELRRLILEDIETGERTLIDEFFTMGKNPALRLSGGGRYICYNVYHPDRTVSFKVYDRMTGKLIHVKRDDGNIGGADVNVRNGKILYQLEKFGEKAQIFLADKDGVNARFVAEGRGAQWSPDGKWFFILHDLDKKTIIKLKSRRVPLRYKTKSKENSLKRGQSIQRPSRKIEIFNARGESQLQNSKFIDPVYITWSPKCNKIILRDDKERTLYLLHFSDNDNSLYLEKIEGIVRDTLDGEYFIHPAWSPDGRKIFLEKGKDSHYGIENLDIYMYELESKNLLSITDTPNILERIVSVTTAGALIIKKQTKGYEPISIEKIIFTE